MTASFDALFVETAAAGVILLLSPQWAEKRFLATVHHVVTVMMMRVIETVLMTVLPVPVTLRMTMPDGGAVAANDIILDRVLQFLTETRALVPAKCSQESYPPLCVHLQAAGSPTQPVYGNLFRDRFL